MTDRLKNALTRSALLAASFVTTASLVLAVGAAFHDASSQPWLRDTPQARAAVARCHALAQRSDRQACVHTVIAESRLRDAGATQVAAASAPRPTWPDAAR